jgi:hypothetical protein
VVERALAEAVDRAELRNARRVVALAREDLGGGVDDQFATRQGRTGGELSWVYCGDADPEADIDGLNAGQAVDSLCTWRQICLQVDHLIAGCPDWAAASPSNGYSLNWNLLKLVQEYARHNGHADLLRERIDGLTGE